VIIADTRSSMVAANVAAAIACAFDVRVDFDDCSRSEQLSDGVAATPSNVARKRLETGAQAPGYGRASAWKLARKRLDMAR